jgi:predicted MFS family arabinose efflux permease
MTAGVASGSAIAGLLVDRASPATAMLVLGGAALTGALLCIVARQSLVRPALATSQPG